MCSVIVLMVWMTSLQMSVSLVSMYIESTDFATVLNVWEFSMQKGTLYITYTLSLQITKRVHLPTAINNYYLSSISVKVEQERSAYQMCVVNEVKICNQSLMTAVHQGDNTHIHT